MTRKEVFKQLKRNLEALSISDSESLLKFYENVEAITCLFMADKKTLLELTKEKLSGDCLSIVKAEASVLGKVEEGPITKHTKKKQMKYAMRNMSCNLYYATIQMPNVEPVTRIYKTLHGLNDDIRSCLANKGLITDICCVTKNAMPLTELSFDMSKKLS